MNVMQRAKAILTDPHNEWDRVAREPEDVASIVSRYVALLAVIPSLSGFIGACLIGVTGRDGAVLRVHIVDGAFGAIFGYVAACAIVLVLAFGIYMLAPLFGGQRGFNDAFKLAAYSFTPVWLCGIFLLLPGLHFLALLGFYGLYVLWLGTTRLTKVPEQMALTFAIAIAACATALVYGATVAQHVIFGTPGF